MKKVRVLFLMPQMGMGGSERLVHSLALRMDRSLFEPSLAWLYGAEVLKEFRDLQVPLHYVPKMKRIDFSVMRKLAEIIRTEGIEIVNAHHLMPAIYAYYACNIATGKPLIFTAHSKWEIEDTPMKWRVVGGYLLRRISVSVGVAPAISSALQSVFGIKASQAVTILNGVDVDLLAQQKDVRKLRDSLGLANGDVVIGIVANLKKVKNHLFLLQAFAKVAEHHQSVKLLIIGQGFSGEPDNSENDLRLYVNNHGLAERVLFLGFRTDITELLHVMDVFCLTSLREGLPMGLIEAMAAGLPVVGTNVEGIRDVITRDNDGVLVELGDIGALKDTLTRLIGDVEWRRKLGRAGREKVSQKYSLERCVREYEQLFLSLANAPAPQ